jgi:alkylated DNA repair dioxygenase AlkB
MKQAIDQSFSDYGFSVVNDVINEETAELCITQFQMHANYLHRKHNAQVHEYRWADEQVNNSFAAYGQSWADSLMLMLMPKVSSITGITLLPCYTYARMYYPGAIMHKHTDRPSCEISLTLTLGVQGDIWPIYIEGYNKQPIELILAPRSMLVYRGTELSHWRNELSSKTKVQYQLFCHYVNAKGPYNYHVFDGRPVLGISRFELEQHDT